MTTVRPLHTQTMHVPVRALALERELYDNYPPFQRGTVWPLSTRKYLIDSMLRGFPLPPLLSYEDRGRYWIVDGQQRLSTIFAFLENTFPTLSEPALRRLEPQPLPELAPNRYFSELDPELQDRFRGATVHFLLLEKTDDATLGTIFRRLQMDVPLSIGEKLASYPSRANAFVSRMLAHSVWKTLVVGNTNREQLFHMGLIVLYLEHVSWPISLRGQAIAQLAAGQLDSELADDELATILRRLSSLEHVFAGADVVARTDMIPLYQASMLLERRGYDLPHSEHGCLAPWFRAAKHAPVSGVNWGNFNTYAQMGSVSVQQAFWKTHTGPLLSQPGLAKGVQL